MKLNFSRKFPWVKWVKISATLCLLALPFVAFASLQTGLDDIGRIFPQGGIAGAKTLGGPFGLIAYVVRILLTLAGGIAVLFVIVGGYQYVTSAGNEEQAEKGKKTVINAIIGIIVVVLSYVIINVIVNLVSGTGGFFGIF